MGTTVLRDGNEFRLIPSEKLETFDKLPPTVYVVKAHPMKGFYLEKGEPFKLPSKLYGTHSEDADRILNTFQSRPDTTGALLAGEKGSGKTMLSKLISDRALKLGIPTILINSPFTGDDFNSLLNAIAQPVVILFDEFEKVYGDGDQQHILTLMDGVYTSKRLFLLTCNDKWKINSHMRNRPGRIYYFLEYAGLDDDFIREYCADNLDNQSHTHSICALAGMFDRFNFDMLQALVEEMNRYQETPAQALRMLNCKPDTDGRSRTRYTYALKVNGLVVPDKSLYDSGTWVGNPLSGSFSLGYWKQESGKKNKKLAKKAAIPEFDFSDHEAEDSQYTEITFDPVHLIGMNPEKGEFLFRNHKGDSAILTRKAEEQLNYYSVLDRGSQRALAL